LIVGVVLGPPGPPGATGPAGAPGSGTGKIYHLSPYASRNVHIHVFTAIKSHSISYTHHHHIRLMNDLSAASVAKHKTYTIVNEYKNKS